MQPPSPVDSPERPLVLLVEEDADWILVMRWSLEPVCDVIVARTVAQALSTLEKRRVAMIATNSRSAGHDGLSLVRQVRALGERAPALVLTGQPDDPHLQEALADGTVAGVIAIPAKRHELNQAVTQLQALATRSTRS